MNRAEENTWRVIKGEEPLLPMSQVIKRYQKFVVTYDNDGTDFNPDHLPDDVFISDMIYGIGTSLSEEYRFVDGANKFKALLLKHLLEDKSLKYHMKRMKDEQTT